MCMGKRSKRMKNYYYYGILVSFFVFTLPPVEMHVSLNDDPSL